MEFRYGALVVDPALVAAIPGKAPSIVVADDFSAKRVGTSMSDFHSTAPYSPRYFFTASQTHKRRSVHSGGNLRPFERLHTGHVMQMFSGEFEPLRDSGTR